MIMCGTGHRPNKLGGYGKDAQEKLIFLARDWLIVTRPERVLTGGALGWDQALAWGAYFSNIPYEMILPFDGFECKWPADSQRQLNDLCRSAANTVFVCDPGYAPWKMQERNKFMVDNSDQVLALWNGTSGGTANCIKYAEKVGKRVINLWNQYEGNTNV